MDKEKKTLSRHDMERFMDGLHKQIEEKNFKSKEELRAYLDSMVGKPISEKFSVKNAKDYAKDIIYEAGNDIPHEERARLAHEALAVDPDCVDAYVILAESEARTHEAQRMYYEKALAAGERTLGKEFFEENKGHFWGIIATRPYMRARAGLTQCLWDMGKSEEAIDCCRKTLELNTNDNMGMRFVLGGFLVSLGRFEEVEPFLNKSDDWSTFWIYTRVLTTFRKDDLMQAAELLKQAIEKNPFVPDYLTGRKAIYRHTGDTITLGGEDEAVGYAEEYVQGWRLVPGAIEWLKEKTGPAKVGRNESCPCGSGKKFKKCCGINMN